jgi:hypothetical protein
MKKLITILVFLLAGISLQAQQTKKVFIVVQSDDYYVSKIENGKYIWRDDISYKKYIKIITTPFDMPINNSSPTMIQGLGNQFAEFVYKNHLKEFAKLKKHLRGFTYLLVTYNAREYDFQTKDCVGCNYQYEKTIIDGFVFNPIEASSRNSYFIKMVEYITEKKYSN